VSPFPRDVSPNQAKVYEQAGSNSPDYGACLVSTLPFPSMGRSDGTDEL
jgi:hypothetical protein